MSIELALKYIIRKAEQSGGKPLTYQSKNKKILTLKEVIKNYPDVAYLKDIEEIHKDKNHPDRSWAVYPNVLAIKNKLTKSTKLPPIQVVGHKVVDGAHRLSALNLLMKEDSSWANFKLEIHEFTPEDWNNWKKETGQPADA